MKNILRENMLRFGTKNLSEQFLKKLFGKDDSEDSQCKGVTVTNPPAYFATKWANTATDLYFYGVTTYKFDDLAPNNMMNNHKCRSNAQMNLINSILSDEEPKPYGAKPKQGAFNFILKGFILKDTIKCLSKKDNMVIHWEVYEFPTENYNKLKETSSNGTTTSAAPPAAMVAPTAPSTTTPAAAPTTPTPATPTAATPITPGTTTPAASTGAPTRVTHMYPGDRNYGYAKDAAGKWWAQNKKTGKWFDLTKYKTSVDNLNRGAKEI